MRIIIRSLLGAGAFRGWLYALAGAGVGVALLSTSAFVAVLIPRPVPDTAAVDDLPVRLVVLGLAVIVLAVLCAIPRACRRGCIRLANALLGTTIPAPPEGEPNRWLDRFRAGAWLLVHAIIGGTATVTAVIVLSAGWLLPLVWLSGGMRIVYLAPLEVPGGPGGVWTLAPALGSVLLFGAIGAGTAALLRRLAPSLLGHRAAERLVALQRQADLLAQRNRLARDLHDSIGHTLTASTIQAAVAARLLDSDPEQARQAMAHVEESSRTALEDLDHVLGVLRENPTGRRPVHTLSDLDRLLEPVRTSIPIHTEISGDPAQVPTSVSREAYRIVQEGLTNALRHAGGAPVTVRLAVRSDRLDIELTNPLPDQPTVPAVGHGGHGLAGLAERVHMLHGEITAGPENGSWRLSATLPLRSTPWPPRPRQ